MKRKQMIFVAALAAVVVACCPCRKGASTGNKPLTETTWSVVEWGGEPFDAKGNYTLVLFDEGDRFGGRGDCNSIMGTYKLSGKNKLELSAVASTRAFCPNQNQEDQYIQELGKVDTYRIKGDRLSLMSDGKTIMVLQAQASSDAQ